MARTGKFGKKYGLFLSDASNEEIVSVSKELMNEMSSEVKTVNGTALAILSASLVSSILMISLISGMDSTSLVGTSESIVFLTRITAIAMLCISAVISGIVMFRMSDASSISSILWRNVRETADDERAYEQTQAIKVISTLLSTAKRHVKMCAAAMAFAAIALGSGFIYELLVAASYI